MEESELKEILRKHRLWIKGDPEGEKADFKGEDLRRTNFSMTNLRCADFNGADLRWADFSGADCAEIAAALGHGRTANSVNLRLKKLLSGHKKPSNNIPDKEAIRIAELHFDGKRSSEIVQMTGWSDKTVARITRLADAIVQLIIVRLIKKERRDK